MAGNVSISYSLVFRKKILCIHTFPHGYNVFPPKCHFLHARRTGSIQVCHRDQGLRFPNPELVNCRNLWMPSQKQQVVSNILFSKYVKLVTLRIAAGMLYRVRTRLENSWILRVHFQGLESLLKISALHSWSLKVLEFFWPAFLIFENFSKSDQPLKSCHTNVTSCGVENDYQCLCIFFSGMYGIENE